MSESKPKGQIIAQNLYNQIVEAAKQLDSHFKGYGKCDGLIIIGFQGKDTIFSHRIGLVSELMAIDFLKDMFEERLKERLFKHLVE